MYVSNITLLSVCFWVVSRVYNRREGEYPTTAMVRVTTLCSGKSVVSLFHKECEATAAATHLIRILSPSSIIYSW